MDIVQYLHGLVSHPLGISNEDASADLLKQYYALSVVHIVENNIDIKDKKNHSLLNVWASQTLPLTKRLARSFHMDEMQTLTLLRTVTPSMMAELNGVAGSLPLSAFVAQHFHRSRTHLPTWSSKFVRGDFIGLDEPTETTLEQANTTDNQSPSSASEPSLSSPNDDNLQTTTSPPQKPKIQKPNKIAWILGGIATSLLVIGTGVWYAISTKESADATVIDPNIATPNIQLRSSPRLSITSGDNRNLYACQAEVGNNELHQQLIQILQKNFEQAGCIIDINSNFGSSLAGLERLESIIAMLKSEPFSSIEIVGDEIFVNTPNPQILDRLVNDIALLAPQFKVSAVPPLDVANLTNQSLAKATDALNALTSPINIHDLARAMSIQVLDFNGTNQIPTQNHAVLTLSAQKLAQNPNAKLIIVSHTDSNSLDHTANVALSQSQAEAIRQFLIQNGASDDQLIAKGVGSTFPIADNITMVGKFKNRRTEFLAYDEAVLNALSSVTTVGPDAVYDNTMMMGMASEIGGEMPLMPNQNTPVMANNHIQQAMPMPNTITPMPVQGMPNTQTYAPPMQETGMTIQPYQGEVIYESTIVQPQPQIYISSSPPPTAAVNTPPPISDEVMELSKPLHAEGSTGVSYEIRE